MAMSGVLSGVLIVSLIYLLFCLPNPRHLSHFKPFKSESLAVLFL